jgi:hypothetical protein
MARVRKRPKKAQPLAPTKVEEATEILRKKADELQEAKLGFIALRTLPLTQQHEKEMKLLDVLIEKASNEPQPTTFLPFSFRQMVKGSRSVDNDFTELV